MKPTIYILGALFAALFLIAGLAVCDCGGGEFYGLGPEPDGGESVTGEAASPPSLLSPGTAAEVQPDAVDDAGTSHDAGTTTAAPDGDASPTTQKAEAGAPMIPDAAPPIPEAGATPDAGPTLCCHPCGGITLAPGAGWTCAGACELGGACAWMGLACGTVVACL